MVEEKGARVRFPPPLVFVGGLVAGIFANRAWPLPTYLDRTIELVLALAAVALGLLLMGSALGLFWKTGQNPTPWTPTPELISEGPYRLTRNPMYVGMTLLTMGIGLWLRTLWVPILALVALAIVHVIAVLPEEAYLTEKFGEPYRAYIGRVRRYI